MGGQLESELCCVILEEKFGGIVSHVAGALLQEPSALAPLALRLKGKIKKALAVLEQFSIVKFSLENTRVTYSVDAEAVTALLRVPRCGLLVKKLYGSIAETIFLQIVFNGRLTCSETIRRVINAHESTDEEVNFEEVKRLFCLLSASQFICRCPPVESVLHGCPLFSNTYDQFSMHEDLINPLTTSDAAESNSRKRKYPEDKDSEIFWRVNYARFDRYFRDELVAELVVPKNWTGDEKSSRICKHTLLSLLKCNETRTGQISSSSSNPVSVFDVVRCARDNEMGVERQDIDWALRVLVEDGRGVIRKAGDSGGGLYVVDFERAVLLSCQNHVECLIREQLDTKAVRVFRLLQTKGHLEEDQIEKLTMMSAKETRELLYAMQEEGYVFTRPVGKTQDFAPARTFYLYYVDVTKTVRGLMEYTCKSLRNLILRRKQEVAENRYLMEQNEKMEYIIDEITKSSDKDEATKEAEISDVKSTYMPAADYAKYGKFVETRTLLDKAEMDVERVLLTLRLQSMFSQRKVA